MFILTHLCDKENDKKVNLVYTKSKYRGGVEMYNELLDTFICVVECGSFTKAAAKLYINSAAVMKQMNSLEKKLSIQLFHRTHRGITLTKAGQSIYEDAFYIKHICEKALDKAKKLEDDEMYTLRIGTSILNPCSVFLDLWEKYEKAHPEYKIQIIPFDEIHDDLYSVVSQLGKDMDFIVGPCDSNMIEKICDIYHLGYYRVCCAVPRHHKLAKKKQLDVVDLYGETLLTVKRGDSRGIDRFLEMLNRDHPSIRIEESQYFYDMHVFNECEKRGIILLTLESWSQVHPSLITIPVNWGCFIPYGIIYAKKPSQKIQRILNILAQ